MAKYQVTQLAVEQLLADVRSEKIAIPELQRPFVWDSVKVRDLMDSLYNGYPVGYLITWQSVGAYLKSGEVAAHQQILIDGQQRVTALRAAVAGLDVIDKRYRTVRIKIAFNPATEEFATLTPVIAKNSEWISDISEFFNAASSFGFVKSYLAANPESDAETIEANISRLQQIKNSQIGVIALNDDLDVETVSEIFIRINSKGVPLSTADFVMSKIATYGDRGRSIRKTIDYFCHLAVAPHAYKDIVENDPEFAESSAMRSIAWLKDDSEDLYDPEYSDLIKIVGIVGFGRGKMAAVVNELSGRDPETRRVDEARIPIAFDRFEEALGIAVKQYNLQNFLMTIKSAGFISPKMITSTNVLNFSYALYLMLRLDDSLSEGDRKKIVRRWFVMSMLTGRNSGSVETRWQEDIKGFREKGPAAYLKLVEEAELTDGFWTVALPGTLETTSTVNPAFQTFLASQVMNNYRGFLSKSITIAAMHQQSGDIHHIVPADYLKKNGYPDRSDYNQVANYALTETSINISISNKPPTDYMAVIDHQIATGELTLGEITDASDLERNLAENAIPQDLASVDAAVYPEFLERRRRLIAESLRTYYEQL